MGPVDVRQQGDGGPGDVDQQDDGGPCDVCDQGNGGSGDVGHQGSSVNSSLTDTLPNEVTDTLKTKWKKEDGIWVRTEEERKETLAKRRKEEGENVVNKEPKKVLIVDLMKFKFVRNVVMKVEHSDKSEDKSERLKKEKTGRK